MRFRDANRALDDSTRFRRHRSRDLDYQFGYAKRFV
jgi:hypothetical protein